MNWFDQLICDFLKYTDEAASSSAFYWLPSTISQVLAAILAFAIAGYALLYNSLQQREMNDESFVDKSTNVRKNYYNKAKRFIIISCVCIFLCIIFILCVFLPNWVKLIISVILIILLFVCIYFISKAIFNILNPDSDTNYYEKSYKEEVKKLPTEGKKITSREFIPVFINFERQLNNLLESTLKHINIKTEFSKISLQKNINILYSSGIINKDQFLNFTEINKIRNLIVHGKIEEVDNVIITKLGEYINIIGKLQIEYKNINRMPLMFVSNSNLNIESGSDRIEFNEFGTSWSNIQFNVPFTMNLILYLKDRINKKESSEDRFHDIRYYIANEKSKEECIFIIFPWSVIRDKVYIQCHIDYANPELPGGHIRLKEKDVCEKSDITEKPIDIKITFNKDKIKVESSYFKYNKEEIEVDINTAMQFGFDIKGGYYIGIESNNSISIVDSINIKEY